MSLKKQLIQKHWPQADYDVEKLLQFFRLEVLEKLKRVIKGEDSSFVGFAGLITELEELEKEFMAAVCDTTVENANTEEPKKRGRKPKVNPEDF